MRRWPAPPTSPCRSIRSTRRIRSSCARSSWWPKQWRRRWAGCQVRRPASGGWPDDRCDQHAGGHRRRRGDRQGRGPLWPLSEGAAQHRRPDRTGPSHRRADARGAGAEARGSLRACPHAGVPSARFGAELSAGADRCRMVDHWHRRDLAAHRLPVLSDQGGRGFARPECEARMTDKVLSPTDHVEPVVFTRDQLDWLPWLEPMAERDLTARHMAGLVDAARARSPCFRLLARDPEVLEARTRTDKDIFYNPEAGLPRAERELAAAATSRFNGCIYCASVHARFAATYSKRAQDVDRLLADGVVADLDGRWNAIVAASVALTATPVAFGPEHVDALRKVGLDDASIVDVINAASFFNWANRLMLSLGEPAAPPAKA